MNTEEHNSRLWAQGEEDELALSQGKAGNLSPECLHVAA